MSLPTKLYTSTGPIAHAKKLHHVSLAPESGGALAIGGYQIANRCNASSDCGLFARQPAALYVASLIQANATPDYVGNVAFSSTANSFPNAFTATNNDGFIVMSSKKFSAISFSVDVAGNGSPVFTYTYYDGTNMSNLATLSTPDFANTGASQLVFLPPSDWVPGTTTAVSNFTTANNATLYAMQIKATTAPGKAVNLSDIRVYEQLDYFDSVSDGNQLIDDLGDTEIQLGVGYSVAAFFDTANANNFVSLSYRQMSRKVGNAVIAFS